MLDIRVLSLAVALALCLASCNGNESTTMEKHWANATRSPASFAPWEGAVAVSLPVPVPEFMRFLESVGAQSYSVGEGSDSPLSAPPPMRGSPCDAAAAAIVFSFPVQPDRSTPRYVAYVDSGNVVCVDRQFSYLAP